MQREGYITIDGAANVPAGKQKVAAEHGSALGIGQRPNFKKLYFAEYKGKNSLQVVSRQHSRPHGHICGNAVPAAVYALDLL